MTKQAIFLRFLLFLTISQILGWRASAMDAFEIQVYNSEIGKPGEYSLETHLNSILVGNSDTDYPEKIPDNHRSHLTFEFARGMNKYWEMGAYLQSSLGGDGIYRYGGAKLRSKFVLPHDETGPYQFGVNVEIAGLPKAFAEDEWGAEIRPIFGYTVERFTILFNPIVGVNLTPGKGLDPDFAPALKALFDTKRGFGLGIEYYNELAEFKHMAGFDRGEQYLFATYDLLDGPIELNIGVGGGLTPASNSTVAKAIFGFGF